MILSMINLLCNLGVLIYFLRVQRFTQLQNEQIQKYSQILALQEERLEVYENLHREQTEQIRLLKEYAAMLRQEAGCE